MRLVSRTSRGTARGGSLPPRASRPGYSPGLRHAVLGTAALLLIGTCSVSATTLYFPAASPVDVSQESSSRPLQPDYRIHADGAVTLRICFNWSCATRQHLHYTARDMREVARQMAICPSNDLQQRLQQLRVGVWQMEKLAQRYQPLLANDEAINTHDFDRDGRMDCIDNTSNTSTYLHVLHELQLLPGWSLAPPQVRDRFSMAVHWTAVVVDEDEDRPWSIDAWYRPNAHLPFVMPLDDWKQSALGWEAPFSAHNPYPTSTQQLCES